MIRTILICLCIFIFFIPIGLPALLICWLAGLISEPARARMSQAYLIFLMKLVLFLTGSDVTIEGLENIPEGSAFFVGNHRGLLDVFVTLPVLKGRTCGELSKIEWSKYPILPIWMRFIHCVFLDRSDVRAGVTALAQVEEELKAGHSFWINPEGTRNHKPEMLPFHQGSFRPAFQTGTPIVPVTVTHTDDAFENHVPRITPAHIRVVFGKPFDSANLKKAEQKALVDTIHATIQETYNRIV